VKAGRFVFVFVVVLVMVSQGLFASLAQAEDESDLDYRFTLVPDKKLPVRRAERPLLLPVRHYAVFANVDVSQVDSSTPWTKIGIGANYGLTKKWEVGILLLPLNFSASKESGVGTPEIRAQYRLLDGPFEVAFDISSILPLVGEFTPTVMLRTRTHLGAWLSFDWSVFGRYEFIQSKSNVQAGSPAELRIQVLKNLSLVAAGQIAMKDSSRQRVDAWAQAGLIVTLSDKNGPYADIGLKAQTARYVLHGRMPNDPSLGNYPGLILSLQIHMLEDPQYHGADF
jgi:hypothetical protein